MTEKAEKTIKLKPGFLLRKVGEERVLIPLYDNVANFNGLITLNASAELLIKLLQQGATNEELTEALILEYGISEELAKNDVAALINALRERNVLENE